MKSDGSNKIKHDAVSGYGACNGPTKPPQSKVPLLPKNMNKPFLKRLAEWFTA